MECYLNLKKAKNKMKGITDENLNKDASWSADSQQIRQILSCMPGQILLQDTQARFLYANEFVVERLGFDCVDQMVGLFPADIRCAAAELHDQFVASVRDVVARNCGITTVYSVYLSTGEWGLYFGEQQPLRNSDGAITGVITQTVTVTHTPIARHLLKLFLKQTGKGSIQIRQGVYRYLDSQQEWNLPPRQGECFFWLLQRKSAREIALLLKLSTRTVESYIDLIKSRFNVKTITELLEVADAKGISNYIPRHWYRK